MSKPDSLYREKYLNALDELERSEKQTRFQLELMRKAMFGLSGAALGLDEQIDASVSNLRDAMRGATGPQVVQHLERVQSAVDEFERCRQQENAKAAERMASLLQRFQTFPIPRDLTRKLRNLSAEIPLRLSQYRQYPDVLNDVIALQEAVLDHATNPKLGLWDRLRGAKTVQSDAATKAELAIDTADSLIKDNGKASTISDEGQSRGSAKQGSEARELQQVVETSERKELKVADLDLDVSSDGEEKQDEKKYYPDRLPVFDFGAEDDYEKVSQRIAMTLAGLVERIEPNELVKHKVELVRSRIERGMDWYALAITLEDIRDILMLRYLQVDQEFAQYLKRVNGELQSIGQALGLAVDREQETKDAAAEFSSTISSHMGKIKKTISSSSDISELKRDVSSQLSEIHDAIATFDQSREQNSSVADELESLLARVKSIESESDKTKELLQQERYKATHDSLTGLNNREAYNERAFAEMKRFERYGHPITMAVCDIDFFKKINDTYGHQVGDKVLRLLAKGISTRLREVDFVARYGGEEFVILMPETTEEQALVVLDKIRQSVSKTPFRFKDAPVKVTISFGLSQFKAKDTVEDVFARADQALYKAKEQGRDCCIIGAQPKA